MIDQPEPLWHSRPGRPATHRLPERVPPNLAGWAPVRGPAAGTGRTSSARTVMPRGEVHEIDVLVIGAGQAGLSAAYHLQRAGFVGFAGDQGGRGSFVVLDAEQGPGGAWRHRWPTLTMSTVNGIHDLPGMAQPTIDPAAEARTEVPHYFAAYEDAFDLPILRPVLVHAVERADDDPRGRLAVHSDHGTWLARAVLSATGTWSRPFWPNVAGHESFAGLQLHSHDYPGPQPFAGRHVVIVGGGISGVGHLAEISRVTSTTWVTRREPVFRETPFDEDAGREVERAVRERVELGLRPMSVVSQTGLLWTPELVEARERGAMERHPMFSRLTRHGVEWPDGTAQDADVILWATGFRHELRHLVPLHVRSPRGGIVVEGTRVVEEPRLHVVGYGPAASTVGANRAGRHAVREIVALLDGA